MADTDSFLVDEIVPNRAVSYTKEGGRLRSAMFEHPGPGKLRRRRILDGPRPHEIRRRAQGRQARPSRVRLLDSEPRRGRSEGRTSSGRVSGSLGIAGGSPGVNAALEIDADRGITVVVLCNADPPCAEKASRKIRGLLPRS